MPGRHQAADGSQPLGYHGTICLQPVEQRAQAGEVIWAGWDVGGLGWSVKINSCNGIATVYGHMEKLLVKVHDMVGPGYTVGLEGSTGWSTGPHLHIEVLRDGHATNPIGFLKNPRQN